ncbi:Rad52/Rad22 family DNA repair protein [Streptomyces sp. NPDC050095]|uniref:Rad52/Rad22 family DNA repair protein n=1 Tax=unclassified Streptomyces TaxID=2593676 RepID=UPI00343EA7B9
MERPTTLHHLKRNETSSLLKPEAHVCQLSPLQLEYLLKPLDWQRVHQDPKGFRYVKAYDVRVWLNRVFGVGGWALETLDLDCTLDVNFKHDDGSTRFNVAYRAQARLTIKAPCGHVIAEFEDAAFDAKTNQTNYGDAHDNAMKSALSGALKRCAVNLGDAFGIGLYYKDIKPDQRIVQSMIPYVGDPRIKSEEDEAA